MKHSLHFTFLLLFTSLYLLTRPVQAQVPAFDWADGGNAPTTYQEQAQARGVTTDAEGNTYVTGTFRDNLTLGSTTLTAVSDYDVYVASLDAAGHYRWAVQAGGNDVDISNDIALDASGNVYVTGYFESSSAQFGQLALPNTSYGASLFVAKLTSNGTWLQASVAGGPNDTFTVSTALAVDGAGNVCVTGGFRGAIAFGNQTITSYGGYNGFVARLDPTGTWQWAIVGGSEAYDFGYGITMDGSSNAYVIGSFTGQRARFGSTTLINAGFSGTDDIFVAKVDAAGGWQWAVRSGGGASEAGQGIVVDQVGNTYITGNTAGTRASFGPITLTKKDSSSDLFVAKLDAGGRWQWVSTGGSTGIDSGTGIALDATGYLLVTGAITGPTATFGQLPMLASVGGTDMVVAQLDGNGSWQWAVAGGGPGDDYAADIASTTNGSARIAGSFEGPSCTFGSTKMTGGAKYYDYFADRSFVASVSDLTQHATDGLTLWPNPSAGTVWATGLEPGQLVQVFDAVGRLVTSNARPAYEASGLILPSLSAGIYLVRCGTQTRRLIIK
ncbi:SBBP repeat-containing protein [Hymenobacter terrenus]|uniref:SBBP repeat-containing protein n=1 Tax=Hymenobacter terrenus TaxID=1629124 RepID=UPI0006192E77|nr:SBBP repeat-containing protein [Hymenobacter terrenus]